MDKTATGEGAGLDGAALCEQALAFVEGLPDPRELVVLVESLRLGRAECVHADGDGVLVRVMATGDYLLAARDGAAAGRVLATLPSELRDAEGFLVTLPDAAWREEAGLGGLKPLDYHVCVYEGSEPLPVRGTLRIEPLGVDDLPTVVAHYDTLPEDTVRDHLEDGWVFGGYDADGVLAGFIGEHDEGSIGMLEVFPEHRRRGYAVELLSGAVNRMLAAGRVPFSQVLTDNGPSLALHRKMGMTVLPGVQCWCW